MNPRVRQVFEEKVYPNFQPGLAHGLRRKPTGEYVSDALEDHWQTFQEGWEYACEQAEKQEPVAWYGTDFEGNPTKFRLNYFSGSFPLYTSPSKREWVGLTDEEIFAAIKNVDSLRAIEVARAIEAKLKEKNGG